MKDFLREVDSIPVTAVVAIAYVTLAVVMGMLGPDREFHEKLHQYGALFPVLVAAGEPWRLLAHAFLHENVVHLLFNMMGLWAFGPALERSLGSLRFVALYLVSSLGGGIAVCLLYDPRQPVVGGSGALFGMMGALVAMNMRSGRHVFAFLDFEGPRRLIGTIVVNLVLGFVIPMVSNTAHIGGLIAGFVATLLWLRPGSPSPTQRSWRLAIGALFASLLFAILMPVTRADWLIGQAQATGDRARQEVLLRAAQRSMPALFQPEPATEPPPRRR